MGLMVSVHLRHPTRGTRRIAAASYAGRSPASVGVEPLVRPLSLSAALAVSTMVIEPAMTVEGQPDGASYDRSGHSATP